MDTLFVILSVVVVLAWVFGRRRVGAATTDGSRDDEAVHGDEEVDEEIDEDAIRAAEDEFWEKDWEEPEEWGG